MAGDAPFRVLPIKLELGDIVHRDDTALQVADVTELRYPAHPIPKAER